jgi:hypothetical protein
LAKEGAKVLPVPDAASGGLARFLKNGPANHRGA